jgi:hypothetical protein
MQTLCFPCCMLLQLMIQKSDPLLYHSRAFIMSREVFVRRLVAQGSTIRSIRETYDAPQHTCGGKFELLQEHRGSYSYCECALRQRLHSIQFTRA